MASLGIPFHQVKYTQKHAFVMSLTFFGEDRRANTTMFVAKWQELLLETPLLVFLAHVASSGCPIYLLFTC